MRISGIEPLPVILSQRKYNNILKCHALKRQNQLKQNDIV